MKYVSMLILLIAPVLAGCGGSWLGPTDREPGPVDREGIPDAPQAPADSEPGDLTAKAVKYGDYFPFTVSRTSNHYSISGGLFICFYYEPSNNPYNRYIPNWSTSVFKDW